MKAHKWTEAEISFLQATYADNSTQLIADKLGISKHRVYGKATTLGLKKSEFFLSTPDSGRLQSGSKVGLSGRFSKGHIPANKGVKGVHVPGTENTWFKKGQRSGRSSELYKPIGSERLSKEGYLERKIHDGLPFQSRWRAVHLILWEETNGPIPTDHALTFKDGNKQNISMDNLELISRADLMRRNTLHRYGKDIALAIQLKGQITRQINKATRRQA